MHRAVITLTTALFLASSVYASGAEPDAHGTESGEKSSARATQIEPSATPSTENPWLRMSRAEGTKGDEEREQAVPPPGSPADTESKIIQERTAREWKLLTYPTGRIPAMPWTRARNWVKGHVKDAEPWPLEGVPLQGPGGPNGPNGPSGPSGEFVTPNINQWTWFGPQPLDTVGTTNNAWRFGIVAGRTGPDALVSDPVWPNVAYAGFVAGGLWRTDDIGAADVTWTPLWEDKDLVTQSVGAIALDPNDHLTIYAGTGDWPAADQHSEGIMKSTDGGVSWTQLGASVFTPYSPTHPVGGSRWASQNIKKIAIDPKDSDTILVGTRYDLYISHDAGTSWQICGFGNHYTNPLDGAGATDAINRISDIYLDGRGATTVAYVAVGYPQSASNGDNGVYRFTVPASGCPAWPGDFTTLFGGFPASTGTANGSTTGRIELAAGIGSDTHLTLYAQVGDATGNLEALGTYVLRPDLGSTTWTLLTGSAKSAYKFCDGTAASTGQDWYDLLLAVDPSNDKTLYIGHIDLFKATVNAGYTAFAAAPTDLTNVYASTCAPQGQVHPDQHAFDFVSGTGGQQFLLGNDGGVFWNSNRGATTAWQELNDSIGTIQFYAGQVGANFAGGGGSDGKQWLFGGAQDNGSGTWDSSESARLWTARSTGGDGFFTAFDPIAGSETAGWWVTEYTYGDLACSVNSGADGPFGTTTCGPSYGTTSTDWSTPFLIDQLHCANAQCRNYLVAGQQVWAAGALGASAPTWVKSATTNLTKCALGCGEAGITANFAPSEPKAAMVGTSDGYAWWTENLYTGASCTQAAANSASFACTPNNSTTWRNIDSANAVLPNRAILGVAFAPGDHTQGYVAVGGFDENTPTTPGHLFSAKWNGSAFTVTNKSGNLPDVPADAVAVDPYLPHLVFVGTHFGFYYTDDITANPPVWKRYQYGLPNTVIRHLTIDRGPAGSALASTTLAAFTYGRGAYALKLPTSGSLCTHPAAPAGLLATATADNQITLGWTNAGGVTWNVYRSLDGFAFDAVATGLATNAWVDTDVSGGSIYYYKVTAVNGCEGPASAVASAQATGACTLAPLFDGLEAVLAQPGSTCSVRLAWSAATSRCGGGVTYDVYRDISPGTPPGGGTLIASGVDPSTACSGGDCTFDDGSIAPSTTYYYVVRAVDTVSALEESNTVEKQGLGVGPLTANQQLLADNFDSSTVGTLGGWLVRNFGGTGTSSWSGVEICSPQSGANEMRFGALDGGGSTCGKNYNVSNLHGVDPNGGAGIAVPFGSANARLTFWHHWEFEVSSAFCGGPCDGAFLAVDANGDDSFALVPSAAILTNPYTGSVPAGFPAWTGAQTSYIQSTVDLDAACNADTGALDGCGGRTVKASWIGYSDSATNKDGWFVDTVRIAADTPGSCAPAGPQSLSVSKSGAGTGTVSSAPAGITCGGDCSESYAYGTPVTLTAAADVGSFFIGWSGSCTGSTTTCDLTMNGAKSVTANFSDVAPPPPPGSVAASDGTFGDKVRVTWSAAAGATSYDVYRNTTSSQPGAAFATGVTSPYDDTSAVAGTTYYYWVNACNATACTTGGPDTGYRLAPPAAPGSVAASDGTFADKVRVTWSAAAGAASYDVYRNTTNTQPGAAFATGVTSPYDNTSAVAGTTYYYWVNACNAAGCTTGGPDTGYRLAPPAAPGGVAASDGTFTDKVRVTWSAAAGATSYDVYRNTTNTQPGAAFATGVTSPYDNASAVAGTTYYYWVNACNAAGCTTGGPDTGYRLAPPAAPGSVAASDGTFTDKVRVTWSAAAGATSYDVYRNTTNTQPGAAFATSVTSPYDNPSAVAGTTYYFWVNACNAAGCTTGGPDTGYRLAPPAVPGSVAGSDGTFTDKVRVTWSAAAGATSYDVYRNTTNTQPGAAFATGVTSPYDDTTAVAGTTYYFWVNACNAAGCTTGGPDTGYRLAPPAAPGAVTASDGTFTDKVRVTWSAASGATSYDVYRNTTNTQPGTAFATGVTSPYDDTTAVAGTTYYFWVNACNAAGCTTGGPDTGYRLAPPAAPGSVAASDGTFADKVRVTWSAASGATSYDVYRNTTNSQPGVAFATGVTSPYDDTTAVAGTTYYFWVNACNAAGCTTGGPDTGYRLAPPAAPGGVAASDGTFSDKARVTWSAASGATSYDVYRNTTNSQPGVAFATGVTSPYDDTTAVAGTIYYYWVNACNAAGCTTGSPDTGYRLAPPAAPSSVTASDGTFTDKVQVTWSAASGATSYDVYRNTSNSQPGVAFATGVTSPYDDSSAVAGTTYYYWVNACNGAGCTAGGPDTGNRLAPPAAPGGVAASDGTYTDKVQVTWSTAAGATSYDVYRNTANSQPGAAFATGVTSPYDDTTAVAGTAYYYWVDACNAAGCTTGGSDTGYRLAPPSAPGSVAASDGTFADKVRVTWSAASGATSYDVYRNTTNSQPGVAFGTGVTSPYDDSSAVAGTTYYYWVNACNAAGCTTGGSDTGYRLAPPAAPGSVAASDGTFTDKVQATWSAAAGATSYDVYRNTSNSLPGAALATSVTSPYDDTTAVAGTTYYYWVNACNAAGCTTGGPDTGLRAIAAFTLTVTGIVGAGSGTVTSDPAGIDCPGTCSFPFGPATAVSLTAAADVDSIFSGWSGDCSGTGACDLTMDADHSVSATFLKLLIFADSFDLRSGDVCSWSSETGGEPCP